MLRAGRLISSAIFVVFICGTVSAQTTAFNYQGSLKDGTNAATGNYDFEFAMYDSLSGGTQLGSTLTRSPVAVANGTFAVSLDFGSQFPGANRFLEVRVRLTGGGAFTPLTPRSPVNSAPYSVKSLNADNSTNATTATSATQLGGITSSGFIQNTTSPQVANFNISGTGNANLFNAVSQYNLGGNRIISAPSGTRNLYVGIGAGQANPSGSNNTFFGFNSGMLTTNGNSNAFFGDRTGQNNTGSGNSFFGHQAGFLNTNGGNNAYFGNFAGVVSNASNNAFFGGYAGNDNQSGEENTLIGGGAGLYNTTGSRNTFVGLYSGNGSFENRNTVENDNTLVGWRSTNTAGVNNSAAFGTGSFVTQSNSIILGSINGLNGATADTRVGIGTTAPSYKLHVFDPSNAGLRVQTVTAGGSVASFGGAGAFFVDANGIVGGRFSITETGNVGIGIPVANAKLQVVDGDIAVTTSLRGIILKSTSGNNICFRILVNDVGTLGTTAVTCP